MGLLRTCCEEVDGATRTSGHFSAYRNGRFGLPCYNSILIFLLRLLEMLPECIKISAELFYQFLAHGACFGDDGVFPHAITLP